MNARRVRLGLAAGGLGLASLLVLAPAAEAADSVPTIVLGGAGGDDVVPVEVDGFYPGGPASTLRYVLRRGPGVAGGSFSIAVEGLEDFDRGCGRPESNSGDTSCGEGPDQGELSEQLLLGLAWSEDVEDCADAAAPTSGGAVREVEDVVLSAPEVLSADSAVCLVLSAVLPSRADNTVQGDLARFDLRLGLTDAQPVEVLGERFDQPAASGGGGSQSGVLAVGGSDRPRALPVTGTALLAGLLWAAAAVTTGALLCGVGRRRRTAA